MPKYYQVHEANLWEKKPNEEQHNPSSYKDPESWHEVIFKSRHEEQIQAKEVAQSLCALLQNEIKTLEQLLKITGQAFKDCDSKGFKAYKKRSFEAIDTINKLIDDSKTESGGKI